MSSLRWQDVNIEQNVILIHDSKRKHHGEDKATRLPSIMPEVLPYLEQVFEEADDGAEFVLPQVSHKNLRKGFLKILKNAGIQPWPKLFQNLRASAITDACEWLPSHVVNEWFGNSEAISNEHYRQTTELHYERANARASALSGVTHSATQQASEWPVSSGTDEKPDSMPVGKMQQKPQSKGGPATTGKNDWAMRDSDPDPEYQ